MSPFHSTLLACLFALAIAAPARAGLFTNKDVASRVLCGKGERHVQMGKDGYCAPNPRCAQGNVLKPLNAKVRACVSTARPKPPPPPAKLPAGSCPRGERPFRSYATAAAPQGRQHCLAGPSGCGPNRKAVESGWDSSVKVCVDGRQETKPEHRVTCPSPERTMRTPRFAYCAPGPGNKCGSPRRRAYRRPVGATKAAACDDIAIISHLPKSDFL